MTLAELTGRRQHTISVAKRYYTVVEQEAHKRGLTVGEMARSILRCWVDDRPMPARHVAAAPAPEPAKAAAIEKVARPVLVAEAPKDDPAMAPAPALRSVPPSPVEVEAAPTRQDDPDFDSPEEIARARELLSGKEEVPF